MQITTNPSHTLPDIAAACYTDDNTIVVHWCAEEFDSVQAATQCYPELARLTSRMVRVALPRPVMWACGCAHHAPQCKRTHDSKPFFEAGGRGFSAVFLLNQDRVLVTFHSNVARVAGSNKEDEKGHDNAVIVAVGPSKTHVRVHMRRGDIVIPSTIPHSTTAGTPPAETPAALKESASAPLEPSGPARVAEERRDWGDHTKSSERGFCQSAAIVVEWIFCTCLPWLGRECFCSCLKSED